MWTPHNKIPNTGRTSLVQTGGPKTVFETLFKYPRVVARHGGAPSVEARERFLRSEEHTSELQSLRHLVCRLLLEKTHLRKAGRICQSALHRFQAGLRQLHAR